jgi:pimeloyl-ACP methyl ester carboxylesterase
LIRGVTYHVNEWGSADSPLLVFLHGWGDAGLTYQFVVDALQKDWHVVAPDWRGFGRSHLRAAAYWFPDYLADLDQLLDHYSPDEPVRLVGHSMGANVAGLYSGVRPERVCAFVNIEGFGLVDSVPADAPARYADWLEKSRTLPRYGRFESFDALAEHLQRRSPRMGAARAGFVARAWATTGPGHLELRADPAHKLPNPVLYRRAEAEACWRNVTAPVLLVTGRESNFLEAFAEHVEEDKLSMPFPDCRTCVIDDAGHMIHFEAPEALARAIEHFLEPTL